MFTSMRALVFVSVLLLPLHAWAEERHEQVFQLPNHGKIHLRVPKGWQSKVIQPSADVPPTIEFTPASGSAFAVLVTALWPVEQGRNPFDLKRVRQSIGEAANRISAQSVEQRLTLKDLKGPSVAGYYFSSTDPAPKPGEYKYMTQGGMVLGELFVTFTALSKDDPEGVAREMLSAMSGATYDAPEVASGRGASRQSDDAVKIAESKASYLVTMPGSALRLRIPKGGLRLSASGDEGMTGKPNYFKFKEETGSLNISGWFERRKQYPGLANLWLEESRSWQAAGVPEPRELSFGWLEGWEAVFYDIVVPGGISSHVRAHWIQAGTWIDLHLSITAAGSSEELRTRLKTQLKSLEVFEGR